MISKILDWDLFNGKLYVIVKYDNGDIRHFYDGTEVSDWDDGGTKPTGAMDRWSGRISASSIPRGSILYFPKIDSATVWDTASGAGFQNMNTPRRAEVKR